MQGPYFTKCEPKPNCPTTFNVSEIWGAYGGEDSRL